MYILVGQNLVAFIATQLYRRQVGDEAWKQSVRIVGVMLVILLAIGVVGAFLLIKRM